MNQSRQNRKIILAAIVAGSLSACGGGSGDRSDQYGAYTNDAWQHGGWSGRGEGADKFAGGLVTALMAAAGLRRLLQSN